MLANFSSGLLLVPDWNAISKPREWCVWADCTTSTKSAGSFSTAEVRRLTFRFNTRCRFPLRGAVSVAPRPFVPTLHLSAAPAPVPYTDQPAQYSSEPRTRARPAENDVISSRHLSVPLPAGPLLIGRALQGRPGAGTTRMERSPDRHVAI